MENPKTQRRTKAEKATPKKNPVKEFISKRALRKQQRENEDNEPQKTWWVQIRLIPIWLRLILIVLLLVVVSIIGLQFGYSYIGDGNPADVLKKDTWTHILDIKNGKE